MEGDDNIAIVNRNDDDTISFFIWAYGTPAERKVTCKEKKSFGKEESFCKSCASSRNGELE